MNHLKDRPFALLGVHIGGATREQLKEVVDKEQLTWRSFVDPGNAGTGPIATRWNLSATPTLYLLDHEGVIRRKWAGVPDGSVMDAAVEKLVEAAERSGGGADPQTAP